MDQKLSKSSKIAKTFFDHVCRLENNRKKNVELDFKRIKIFTSYLNAVWCGQFYCLFCRIKKLFVVGWQKS